MKKLRKVILMILIYIGLILVNTNVFAATGTTTESTTRLREAATTDSSTVTLISINQKVEVLSEEGEWYKVNYVTNGKTLKGYIRKDMLSVEGEVSVKETNSKAEENKEEEIKNEQQDQENVEEQLSQDDKNEKNESNILKEGYTGSLANNIEIKILPVINSTSLGEIEANSTIEVSEIINKWCYVKSDFISGWTLASKVQSDNTSTEKEEPPVEEKTEEVEKIEDKEEKKEEQVEKENKEDKTVLYVNTQTVNMREKDDTSSRILKQLSINDTVMLLEKTTNTWNKVEKNGVVGYIASKYLSENRTEVTSRSLSESREEQPAEQKEESKPEVKEDSDNKQNATPIVSSSKGADVVSYAKQYLGYRYVSGGSTPKKGFDCSGFTCYVYKNFGVNLSRTSKAQASNGREISKSELQLGDLVIFKGWGTNSIGHVGIYIGDNSFIHAANEDKGVVITSLSDSYYSSKYVTARRVID